MRVLDWSNAESDIKMVQAILAVINPSREPSDGYIEYLTNKEFDKGLDSYVGTGGWYVTVYRTSEVRDGAEVWRPHVTLMPYSVARYLNIKNN